MFRKLSRTLALVAVALAAASFPTSPAVADDTTLDALVAANATKPFAQIEAAFERAHPGVTIRANFAGTQILEQQLESGAPCDVFLSADRPHIEKLAHEGLVEPYRVVAHLHEAIVVPKTNPARIASLRDLGKPGVKLVIGVPDVPIGKYARAIIGKADRAYGGDFRKHVLANVVSLEVNVKSVLQKVILDEADAGIVYRTDVDAEALRSVDVIEIPPDLNVRGTNYIAVGRDAKHPALARELERFMLSPAGRAVFAKAGYDRP